MIGAKALADVARTPAILEALASGAGEIAEFTRAHLLPGAGGKLYIYGCGDGLVAAECVAGPAIAARTALDFLIYDVPRLSPADRVLAVSMSGNVDRGVEAAEMVLARGLRLAVLTNIDGGRLGATGAPRLSLGIELIKPFLSGTATYSGTLFALQQIAATLNGTSFSLPTQSSIVIEKSCAVFSDVPVPIGVRFLTTGINRATAEYGAAKLVEVTRLPAWHADIEEFAHSQFWSANPGELVVYIVANEIAGRLAAHSGRVLAAMGFSIVTIAVRGCMEPGPGWYVDVPALPEAASPLALALPVQLLALHLACASGLDPDTRAHLKDDELRFSTSRKLTRSTLVGTGH